MAWIAYKDTGYFISDTGQVKNKNGKILTPINRNGYFAVNIHGKLYRIHRLVAESFIDNVQQYDIINHKDGNKHNNIVSNLEWCNRSYNQHHAYATGLQIAAKGIKHTLSKPVIMLNSNGKTQRVFGSIQEAATWVGLKSYTNISKCCDGKRKRAAGYFWKWCQLPKSEVVKLIGRHLTWEDEPVEI